MIDEAQVRALAEALEAARIARRPIRLPSATHPGLTLADAYRVQRRWAGARIAAGARRIGYKVAMTTPATQRGLGTDRPGYGILLDDMLLPEGALVPASRFIRPRVEMELAFVMRATPPADAGPAEALAAVDWVTPAWEIVDSRVAFSDAPTGRTRAAVDIVADGGATAGLVLSGRRHDPARLDLARIGAALEHDGAVEESGLFAVVMGAPERALAWLARALAAQDDPLLPGDIVLTGSAIKAYPARPGDRFTADFGALGLLPLHFAPEEAGADS